MSVANPIAGSKPSAGASARPAAAARAILEGPLLPLLVRLALPTVTVMFLVTLLAVAETWFVSGLGTDAIAAAAMVLPVALLMTMVSNGGIGGGVSASIARARGAGKLDEAQSLAWHALVLAIVLGAAFTICLWLGGPTLYRFLGGSGASLEQALRYSNVLFGGAIFSWILMLLQASLRGTGNVRVPALVVAGSVALGLALSPALIYGWGGLPQLGVAGAGASQVLTNLVAVAVVVAYMRSKHSTLRLRPYRLQRAQFGTILRIGVPSSLNAVMSNLALTALTAAAGTFGVSALAGYGIAARLDGLLVPILFGFGTAVLTVVGTNLGAGQIERARAAARVNAIFVGASVGTFGLIVAAWPELWLSWFTRDPQVLEVGRKYLQIVGPTYALLAVTMELYFAGQGAGRVGWPLAATVVRLSLAVAAALWVSVGGGALSSAFGVIAVGTAAAAAVSVWGFRRTNWSVGTESERA